MFTSNLIANNMKPVALRFFSLQDNIQPIPKDNKQTTKMPLTGLISKTGKLVLPLITVQQLSIDPAMTRFKVSVEQGGRKIKALYLTPTNEDHHNTVELVKDANSYSIAIAVVLRRGGIYYQQMPYIFTIHPFEQQNGVRGCELRLDTSAHNV